MDDFTRGVFADTSFQDLIERAKNQSESAPEILRRTVYLYYLSRYHLSVYETIFSEMPNQVLNEYRNGLDHLMRFLSAGGDLSEDDRHRNLDKMEGHMQRALLDLCKHYAYRASNWADEFEKDSGGMKILSLVSEGQFARKWRERRQVIHTAFVKAKMGDSHLVEDNQDSDDIVELYIAIAHECHQLMQSGEENRANIAQAGRLDSPPSNGWGG